ncbi:twin-arginine translocase TatA/TatE family subunit [Carboxylicivirga mesophila]|uniref:Twin-arginine translocase TatA/TatE family subunit n=1 Tax=Carboxylicivirga mesophila TaxID=1166478 RepID=A0ABS5KFG5_9BACT|nr:twin-arginine translocase TatA/TatE family subunit [Carboxylicivirga mesophila]MBS2213527.1 twin-arginine translocase TatA/TatE family subunit [Carboxylicivirga mesophila]
MNTILFISGGEIIIVVLVVLLLFGAKSIPDVARMLGKGMNEFRRASEEIKREFRENTSDINDVVKETREGIDTEIKAVNSAIEEEMSDDDPYNLKQNAESAEAKDDSQSDEVPPVSPEGPVSREDKLD